MQKHTTSSVLTAVAEDLRTTALGDPVWRRLRLFAGLCTGRQQDYRLDPARQSLRGAGPARCGFPASSGVGG